MTIVATRSHTIDTGHRVHGQGGKCEHLHGHTYKIHFTVTAAQLDEKGMVIDFGVIKTLLCEWLDREWDHRFLMGEDDPWWPTLDFQLKSTANRVANKDEGICDSIVVVPFNPTAENMADHLLRVVGPQVLPKSVVLTEVTVEETPKCSARSSLQGG